MAELTELIKHEIFRRYRSVRQFAISVGIPQSTVVSALSKGIGGTAYDTVLKICKALDIEQANTEGSVAFLTHDSRKMLDKYATLDELGKHTVNTVLVMEYERCLSNDECTMKMD